MGPAHARITVTAYWHPAGPLGLLNWYALAPSHGLIFHGMARAIALRAEEAGSMSIRRPSRRALDTRILGNRAPRNLTSVQRRTKTRSKAIKTGSSVFVLPLASRKSRCWRDGDYAALSFRFGIKQPRKAFGPGADVLQFARFGVICRCPLALVCW